MHRATEQLRPPAGGFTTVGDEMYYRISGFHRMDSFLMTLSSDADLWMFVTSSGGLTCGRIDSDHSLFPYETVDKLYHAHHTTGPITLMWVNRPGMPQVLWEPFGPHGREDPSLERNLYKNIPGNRLIFEEIHHGLNLAFRYRWAAADAFGWVRAATVENRGEAPVRLELLDGLRNVLPYGVSLDMMQKSSTLTDAYKHNEWDPATGMAIFSLTARILDRPEAAEELRANVAWCHGLPDFSVSLAADAVETFHGGGTVDAPRIVTGRRGNYLVSSTFRLDTGESKTWHMAADTGLDAVDISALGAKLLQEPKLSEQVESHLDQATQNLLALVGSNDGLEATRDTVAVAHHAANVLFNGMRGGFVDRNYDISTEDFAGFLRLRNRPVFERLDPPLRALPPRVDMPRLQALVEDLEDPDAERLFYEYLPLFFSRRHGDPSRPWNHFSIRVKTPDHRRMLRYEGNWRDIFQNWEGLAFSYPGFLMHFTAKFVNASTLDGFNPYRISREGIDWEIPDPQDPWSHIGYWGDHQIAYLLKFLEAQSEAFPGRLQDFLARPVFSYANVPYRIKPYRALIEDPQETIVFDTGLAARIASRVEAMGTDGKLVLTAEGAVYHVTLLEKLLVPALSKLCNLVPDGGLWMNTQRPEWNDANNSLAGHGLSVVTLCYLRRYLAFLNTLLAGGAEQAVPVTRDVVEWCRQVTSVLSSNLPGLQESSGSDAERMRLLDRLGEAFSAYREGIYSRESLETAALTPGEVVRLCRAALSHIDHALDSNRRENGLYHAYNLVEISSDKSEAVVRRLPEMLEGQVAALSSGHVSPQGAVRLLAALEGSALFRPDQNSFLLYGERRLPSFLEKNVIPETAFRRVPLLTALLKEEGNGLVGRDAFGAYRFRGDIANADVVNAALDRLGEKPKWREAVAADREQVLEVFESVFHHRSFTGRSGTMYAYEGIGCIYWHMVAKLLLAVQELARRAWEEGEAPGIQKALAESYDRIRSGLGFAKSAAEFGAFPTDPYSHTPRHAGAQQPGMTGSVKEMLLARMGELGVRVREGRLWFQPFLLHRNEFLEAPGEFAYVDLHGDAQRLHLEPGSLAFTVCQIPVVYTLNSSGPPLTLVTRDGRAHDQEDSGLSPEATRGLFLRDGALARIQVNLRAAQLRA